MINQYIAQPSLDANVLLQLFHLLYMQLANAIAIATYNNFVHSYIVICWAEVLGDCEDCDSLL